jgi:endonuclease/exonuclease/phosphatase family metal-dependent hydrolase
MKLLTIILYLVSVQLVFSQPLKVMTYNLRFDTPNDGVNQWSKRIDKVNSLIKKYDADLIGVQEALKHQIGDILKELAQYGFVGVGRDDGKEKGEYSAILFKKERFEIVLQKTFWLSETPEVPGSKSWDAAITRIVTLVKFRDKKTKKEFFHLNTHFDHIGLSARKNSALLLHQLMVKEGISKDKIPVMVSGDFNSEPSEETYQIMITKNEVQLFDSRSIDSSTGTFCGFEVGAMPCKTIDYIFLSKEWSVKKYSVIQDNDGKYYPSDHLPVMVELMANF